MSHYSQKAHLLICLMAFASGPLAGQPRPPAYGEPLVVLKETQPYSGKIDTDEPDFVLYSTGQVIYKKRGDLRPVFYSEQLTRLQTQQLIFNLDLLDTLMTLPNQIIATSAARQPFFELILNFDTVKSITVYGNLRDTTDPARKMVPPVFLDAFDHLIGYGNGTDSAWVPDRFEVILSADSASKSKPAVWPAGWPGLKDSSTLKRRPDLYSIYMDKSQFKTFLIYTGQLKMGQEVIVDNRKFMIAWRFPFPNLH